MKEVYKKFSILAFKKTVISLVVKEKTIFTEFHYIQTIKKLEEANFLKLKQSELQHWRHLKQSKYLASLHYV